MAKDKIFGTDWTREELDAIVTDYFAMLRDEQAGRGFNKAAHNRALQKELQRTKGSIEFKHQNISAVLMQLGLPRIDGYVPAWNFQTAIAEAISRFLAHHPEPIPFGVNTAAALAEPPILFAEAPPAPPPMSSTARRALERVARRYDPALKDQLNRELGIAGEREVFESERRRLQQMDRADLARKVRWVSQEDGDGLGYDIRSYEQTGAERFLEVKTTRGGSSTPFYLTRNENAFAAERPDAFRLFRIYDFAKKPRLFTLSPPLSAVLQLEPITFRASIKHSP